MSLLYKIYNTYLPTALLLIKKPIVRINYKKILIQTLQ